MRARDWQQIVDRLGVSPPPPKTDRDSYGSGPTVLVLSLSYPVVIAGLEPAIHSVPVAASGKRDGMDAMVEPWHDDREGREPPTRSAKLNIYPFRRIDKGG